MDLADSLRRLAERGRELRDSINDNEDATKQALVLPFLRALGYDDGDTRQVAPEQAADVRPNRTRKVDYKVFTPVDSVPVMMIECKPAGMRLGDRERAQLAGYYNSEVRFRFGVLTNGLCYRFYADLQNLNHMDEEPFLELLLDDLDGPTVDQVAAFAPAAFDPDHIRQVALESTYTLAIGRVLAGEHESPSKRMVQCLASGLIPPSERLSGENLAVLTKCTKRAFDEYVAGRRLPHALPEPLEGTTSADPERALGARSVAPKYRPTEVEASAGGELGYRLLRGDFCRTKKKIEIVTEVFGRLYATDQKFFEKFERQRPEFKGGRPLVARTVEGLQLPATASKSYTEVDDSGWYIDTNRNSSDMEEMLKIACAAANIRFGKDLVIEGLAPTATTGRSPGGS
jgi:hypothetical protein